MVIFDFDGVIADSQHIILGIINRLAAQDGRPPLDAETYRNGSVRQLMDHFKVPWFKIPWYVRTVRAQLHAHAAQVGLQPHVMPLITWAHAHGIPLAIVSSNTAPLIEGFRARHLPTVHFEETVGSVSLWRKHRHLKKLPARHKLSISRCVYVGDEVRDVEAARQVGMASLAVTWGKESATTLQQAQPTWQADDGATAVACVKQFFAAANPAVRA